MQSKSTHPYFFFCKSYNLLIGSLFLLVATHSVSAQNLTLPYFTRVNGTVLGNTNGNWITVNPSQPGDIDLLETRIYQMPPKGSGVSAIEFRLFGADGGTAKYGSGAAICFANGGQGARINFTLDLIDYYGKPFKVTFGKKGESAEYTGYLYCSAGGGGSTGMSWLIPGIEHYKLNYINTINNAQGYLIAAAGGGGGGFATQDNVALHGAGATALEGIFGVIEDEAHLFYDARDENQQIKHTYVGGGSVLRNTFTPLNLSSCCGKSEICRRASSAVFNTFDYTTGVIIGSPDIVLQTISHGQGGGKPTDIFQSQTSIGVSPLNAIVYTKPGARGGCGFGGGGAGISNTSFTGFALSTAVGFLTSGGGGTGSILNRSMPGIYPNSAPAGTSAMAPYLLNQSVAPVTNTATPQSGYFMYRTIADTTAPLVNVSNITLYISYGSLGFPNNSVALTRAAIDNGSTDNDSIKIFSFSKSLFTCADVGTTQQVTVTAIDFAGNSTSAVISVTVQDTTAPVRLFETPQNPFDPNSVNPNEIDVTNGPYTLTAANFPQAAGGCNSNITVHFPPTTFTCVQSGTQQTINFYYTNSAGRNSPTYSKTFTIKSTTYPVLYVDESAVGANNGSSWTNAFTRLQDALNYGCAESRDIYVAQGTYYPDRGSNIATGNRSASFIVRDGFRIFGGFPAGGGVLNSRKPETYPTLLSGNIGNMASVTDNSYHVVTINGNNTQLDGLTIQDGYANDSSTSGGGGIFMQQQGSLSVMHNITLRQCKLLNNFGNAGGAVYLSFANNVTANRNLFFNCIFQNNSTLGNGGAVRIKGSLPSPATQSSFTQCIMERNTATQGAGIYFEPSVIGNLFNCTFSRNKANVAGGAIHNSLITNIRNSILYFDSVGSTSNEISNNGTINVFFSNLQGSGGSSNWNSAFGTDQGNNIDVNPQFLAGSLLEITPASLCRNAGNKNFISEPFDIRGTTRVLQDTVDIGAYESNPVVYVAWDAPVGGNGQSWATAYNNLQDGLDNAGLSGYQKDVWIKAGTYKPTRATNGTDGGRFNTFFVRASNGIYGGFAGNETQLTQRNVSSNPTILSGDIGTATNNSDNTYHVVTLNSRSPRLDGLIIEAGNADDAGNLSNRNGGAIYDPGIFAGPHPVIFNCVLRNNNASGNGGAVYVSNTVTNYTMDIVQTVFYGNNALRGGAVYVQKGGSSNIDVKARFYNCTAVSNTAAAFNAAGFAESYVVPPVVGTAILELNNCLLLNNTTQNADGNVIVNNSYIGSNSNDLADINNPAGADGLMMTSDDGYRLQTSSAAINYGNNALIYSDITKDITNAERILQLQVDAGAYESTGCLGTTKLYVDASVDSLNGNGLSWATAFKYLNDALKMANSCPFVDSVLIAEGTYYPSGDISSTVSTDVAFEISRPLKLFGGYPSGGGVRNVQQHPVVLSGDINTQSVIDNATHIMLVAAGTADTTLIDGITFRKGYAYLGGNYTFNGKNFLRNKGGAISSHTSLLHINDCNFYNNTGGTQSGAVHINGGRFISTGSLYDGNTAGSGGAVCAEALVDTLRLVANVWVRNTASTGTGGAVFGTFPSTVTYTDMSENVFAFNNSNASGGAVYLTNGDFELVNNTFYKNTAGNSAGGFNSQGGSSSSVLANNVFKQNTDAAGDGDFVCLSSSTILNNYLTGVPQFTDTLNLIGQDGLWMTADDGLKLKPVSSMLNGGDNSMVKSAIDITGAARIQYAVVDPGAYENENVVTRWYVSAAQDSISPDGTSWVTAFPKFQDGVNAAKAGDSVWVAHGVYIPEVAGTSFTLKNRVKVFGGFEGTEQQFIQRNLGNGWNAVLEGRNAAVLQSDSTDSTTLLDGFVIRNGNTGGNGGGILNTASSARYNNLVLADNLAVNGGAIANIQSSVQITNAVFVNNTATTSGGALYDSASTTAITNVTVYGNTAQNGGALAAVANSFEPIGNSVFWDNRGDEFYYNLSYSAITYSLLQTENAGQGNITGINPWFTNPYTAAGFDGKWFTPDDGFVSTYRSPFVNNGSNGLVSAIASDVTGAQRIQNGVADMGAYESPALNFCDSIAINGKSKLYVNINQTSSGDGSSWSQAFRTLNEALDIANYCTSIDSILVAGGTYYPTGYQAGENRLASFTLLRSGIHLLGGYSGNDSVARNAGAFNTTLNGNINNENSTNDNSYHVITLRNVGNNCTLDGFVITNGRADSTSAPYNTGGGVFNDAQGTGKAGNPTISNCVFYNNTARSGGGLYNNGSLNGEASATVINCVFSSDTALMDGGAVYNNGATGTSSGNYINCTFSNNYAMGTGGAVCNQGSGGTNQTTFQNCVIYNNASATGTTTEQEVYNINSSATSSFSLFQYGLPASMQDGGNNITGNPVYVHTAMGKGSDNAWMTYDDGPALQVSSPAVKTGTATGTPLADITGTIRGTLPDRGAYQNTCAASSFTLNITGSSCDSIYSPSYRKIWYSSGVYLDTIFSPIGCDSFITVNLTLGQRRVITIAPSSCGSYTSPAGKIYDTSGVYTDTLQTATGCDSILIIQLTVNTPPQPAITQNGNILSTQSFSSYQWLQNNEPINGATAQSYTALQNGNYSVVVTDSSSCSDTSALVNVTGLSVAGLNNKESVWLYPNPNYGTFKVAFSSNEEKEVYITDIHGRIVAGNMAVRGEHVFHLENTGAAVYFLHVRQNGEVSTMKFAVLAE
jgi:hypothetical protein